MKLVSGGNSSKSGQQEPMSIEEVRALPSFADWDDEQITDLLSAVQTYVSVVYGVWARHHREPSDLCQSGADPHYQIISLNPQPKAA